VWLQRKTVLGAGLKLAEIHKMVDLDEDQKKKLNQFYGIYVTNMDFAINEETDRQRAAFMIHVAKKTFDKNFLRKLTEKQKSDYIRAYAAPEITEKARVIHLQAYRHRKTA
jgi:hypothetical protein